MEARYYLEQLNAQKEMMAMTTAYLTQLQQELEEKNKALAEAHESIRSSVRFAGLIQNSFLPDVTLMQKYFRGAEFKLRQQIGIGGDTILIRETPDGIAFGLFDCTGHGIPAAMLSVSVSLMLTELMNFIAIDPSHILEELNNKLHVTFRNCEQSKAHLEGSLFFYNTREKKISYVAAHGKALLIEKDGRIIELFTEKVSIGLNPSVSLRLQDLRVNAGDKILLFSDGLTDQFGGEKEKKFTRARLKNLLAANFNKDSTQLCDTIERAYLDWKGHCEQTDDVSFFIIEV